PAGHERARRRSDCEDRRAESVPLAADRFIRGPRRNRSRAARTRARRRAMSAPKRQIAALSRAVSRRQRLEQDLRTRLAQLVPARVRLVEREGQARDHAAALEAQARSYRQRISAMMSGAEPFSIDTLTAIRLYADEVDRAHSAALDALTAAQQVVAAHDA